MLLLCHPWARWATLPQKKHLDSCVCLVVSSSAGRSQGVPDGLCRHIAAVNDIVLLPHSSYASVFRSTRQPSGGRRAVGCASVRTLPVSSYHRSTTDSPLTVACAERSTSTTKRAYSGLTPCRLPFVQNSDQCSFALGMRYWLTRRRRHFVSSHAVSHRHLSRYATLPRNAQDGAWQSQGG